MGLSDSVEVCIADALARYAAIDAEVEGAIDRMAAIGKHVNKAVEETLARHGMSHGEYKLLLRLATRADGGPMSVGDLSRSLMLSSGATTNRLDRMETAGLLRRIPDPHDRRGVLVELTPQGREQIDAAVIEQAAKEIDLLAGLTGKELTTLNGLLRKVLVSLEAQAVAEAAAG